MALTGAAAYGVYSRNASLPDIVGALNRAGFGNEDLCMVLSPAHPVAKIVRDARIFDADVDDSAVGSSTIGWFSKFGAVVIPTVGFFIRSQAFLRALIIEQDFGALCGGSTTLACLGFAKNEAARLSLQLGDSGVLMYVICPENATADWVTELLRCAGASEAARLGGIIATNVPESVRVPKHQTRVRTAVSYTPREIPPLALSVAGNGESS